jgi:glycosyltransferase involved in cell wall biosynthesis
VHAGCGSVIIQLVRECPPGYGGVERVAHEMALQWERRGIKVQTYCLQYVQKDLVDLGWNVTYDLESLPRFRLGRFFCPLPTPQLFMILNRRDPLYVHLPCPALLILTILARLRHPRRSIRLHWHAFLEQPANLMGCLISLYQWLALCWAASGVQAVTTTSPVLADILKQEGVPTSRIQILPCCLGEEQETRAQKGAQARLAKVPRSNGSLRLLFIGRLDSYKRVDWLIESFCQSRAGKLDVVGEGPRRAYFQDLASRSGRAEQIFFHGRLNEISKQALLQHSDLLILPADSSNEAFGIVQLEAMASGIPSLALDCPRSGAAWVGQMKLILGLSRLGRDELAFAIDRLVENPDLYHQASEASMQRYAETFSRSIWKERFAVMFP